MDGYGWAVDVQICVFVLVCLHVVCVDKLLGMSGGGLWADWGADENVVSDPSFKRVQNMCVVCKLHTDMCVWRLGM